MKANCTKNRKIRWLGKYNDDEHVFPRWMEKKRREEKKIDSHPHTLPHVNKCGLVPTAINRYMFHLWTSHFDSIEIDFHYIYIQEIHPMI